MFSWLKSAPETTDKISPETVTLASLDARVRRLETILLTPAAYHRPVIDAPASGIEDALASLGRAIQSEASKRA
jgi:hypothetical protein